MPVGPCSLPNRARTAPEPRIAIGTPFYGNIPPRLIGPLTSNGLGRYSHRKESP